ncbi:MAG: trypsin-like peptidase domain-containing protein [Planctomycetes bacterium]|nr:trypsin-like peptidase domain-containing protein [Planctomycetota bacterium]
MMLILGLFLSIASAGVADDALNVHDRLLHATAWIRTTTQGVGTGWVVDAERRWLITNLHVVGDQDRVEAFFVDEKDGKPISERSYYLENQKKLHEDGRAVRGKVIRRSEASDLALVELEKLPSGIKALPLAENIPGAGQCVYSVGNRHDSDALWLFCTSEIRQVGRLTDGYFWRGKKLSADVPCLIAQSPILPGDSGGPLVNERCEVVGVISGFRQAPQATIAIQASEVRALLGEPKEAKRETADLIRKLSAATGWIRPNATEGRAGCWVVDHERRLVLATATGAGRSDQVDVLFPRADKGEIIAEASAYVDRIALRKDGFLARGVVLSRDPKRDLALIELETIPKDVGELPLGKQEPRVAERIHALSHPSGVELLWLYSSGSVRQTANVELVPATMGENEATKPRTLLLQIPHQAGSSGGPVVNDKGDVVGMLAAREGAQQQLGYAIASAELSAFLEAARPLFDPKTAKEHQLRGRYLMAHGRTETGLVQLAKAVSLEREAGMVRELCDAFHRTGRYDGAKKMAEINADQARIARALAALGEEKEARELATKLIEADRKNAIAWLARGSLGATKESLADLDEAIFLAPEMIEPYWKRAEVHEKLGDEEKALADWTRTIEMDPYSAEPIRRRAAVFLKKNEPKRAIADFERLVELRPTDAQAQRSLALAWLAAGDDAKALPAITAALRWKREIRTEILDDILKHGEALRVRWPDDPLKKLDWYKRALNVVSAASESGLVRLEIDGILEAKDAGEMERRIRVLARDTKN